MSRKTISIIVGVGIVLLLAAVVIPYLVPARFTSSGKLIHFKIQVVTPEGGAPIHGAEVQITTERAVTDAEGYCDLEQYFQAHGKVGLSGECLLCGTLRVAAQDFSVWEKELASLFGKSYDYFNKGTQITYVVALVK